MRAIEKDCPGVVTSDARGGVLKLPNKSSGPSPRRQGGNTWSESKPIGDALELGIAEYFAQHGCEAMKTVGRVGFDLMVFKLIEVKRDDKALETGRVAIEIEYRGEASGIYNTSAQLWAIGVGDTAFLVGVNTLRRAVESGRFRTTMGGDFDMAKLVLIPIPALRDLPGVEPIRLPQSAKPTALGGAGHAD